MSRPPSGPQKFSVVCRDRKTGTLLWKKTVTETLPHEGHHSTGSFASYSPVTDGKLVWAGFGSRGIYCFDMQGNIKWSKPLVKMTIRVGFGEGASIALSGNAIIAVSDHEGESVINVFQKQTGDLLWSKPRDEGTSWTTPLAVQVNGNTQIITSATTLIRSYDLKTGDIVWQCTGLTQNTIPCPVTGFGKVFCTSGFRGSAFLAIELGKTGDLTGTDAISWQLNEATPYVPSPLLYGDKIYVCSSNKAIVSCYKAETGKPVFVKQPLEAMRDIYASPVAAGGHVYFVGRDGTCQVISNADKFEVLATNKLEDPIDASPAIVGDELYLKGKDYLYCIAEK